MCVVHVVFFRRCDDWRRDSRRLVLWLHWAYIHCIWNLESASCLGVSALGVVLPVSCIVAFLSTCTLCMEYFVGVSTLAVGFWVPCRMASPCSLAWFGIEVGVATVGVATRSVGPIMCRRASRG
jgi:hypothetical protein